MPQISNPFAGSASIISRDDQGYGVNWGNLGGWLTGSTALRDITGGLSPTYNTFQAQPYNFQAPGYDQGYALGGRETQRFGTMGLAAQNREAASLGGQTDAARGQQQALAEALVARARGEGSAAQLQMQQGLQSAQSQALGMAASQRGGIAGANIRDAMRTQQDLANQAIYQTGAIRAQEQAAAEAALGQHLSGMRQQDYQTAATNLQAQAQQRALNDQLTQYYMSLGMSADQAQIQAGLQTQNMASQYSLGAQGLDLQAQLANQEAEAANRAGLMSGAGGLLGGLIGMVSDRYAKDNIARADTDLDEMLSGLAPYRFRYKTDNDDEPEYLGIMAQDLEKSTLGQALVKEIDGVKMVDTKRALMAALASIGRLDERLREVEG